MTSLMEIEIEMESHFNPANINLAIRRTIPNSTHVQTPSPKPVSLIKAPGITIRRKRKAHSFIKKDFFSRRNTTLSTLIKKYYLFLIPKSIHGRRSALSDFLFSPFLPVKRGKLVPSAAAAVLVYQLVFRMCKIQEVYNACSMMFTGEDGPPPSPNEIRWLQELLGKIEAVDVGIGVGSDDDDNGRGDSSTPGSSSSQVMKYIHIYECDEFSIGVFCLPAGAAMPLHDHPEMVVLTKVLYGSLSVKAYDWVRPPPDPTFKRFGLASLTLDNKVFDQSSLPTVLFPTSGGNIHSVTALTPCAFLDVLSPPYSDNEGRPSTYYNEIPIPSLPDFVILEGRDVPEDLVFTGAPYLGPELILYEGEDEDVDVYFQT